MKQNETVAAVICRQFGAPEEVLEVIREDPGEPGPGQARVRMLASPVNPADINVIQGKYGFLPPLPAHCGNEGAGEVEAVGSGVEELQVGTLVRPVPGVGTWRQALVARVEDLTPLPGGMRPEHAAMLTVNPATAFRMLHDFVDLEPGEWVLQNAGTSAVGRHVVQLCRHLGLRSLSVVRREDARQELRELGADEVLTEEESSHKRIRQACGGGGAPRLALNGVGGRSAMNLALALAEQGTLVTYGAMGMEPVKVPNGPLIFRELRLAGFWVTAWYARATAAQTADMLQQLADLFAQDKLTVNIEARYPLEEALQAVAHATSEGRKGKILLEM